MAAESISSPVTLDISGSDGGNSRRSLAGADSVRSREKILPRYLRASTGSCHDFCKYGKKHESEENAKLPFRKRNMKKPSNESNLVRSLDLQERKKTTGTEFKYFPNSRSRTPDSSEAVEFQLSPYSPDRNNSSINGVRSDKEKTSAAKPKSKHSRISSSPHDTSNVLKFEVSTTTSDRQTSRKHEILSKGKKTSMAKPKSLPNLKLHLSDAPKVMLKGGSPSSKKLGVSSKEGSLEVKEKSFSKSRNASSKLKSHAEKLPLASVPSEGLSVKRSNGISDMKMGKRTNTAKVSVKKALSSPRASLSLIARPLTARKNQNLKVVPLQKNQNKVEEAETEQPLDVHEVRNSDSLEEKTLYVIKMETENILLESDKNENCVAELSPPIASSPKSKTLPMSPPLSSHGAGDENEFEYTEDSSNSEYYEDDEDVEDETANAEEVEILEGENRGRPRNSRMVCSDEKDCRPMKLSFRRGKVVDIQSENNGARRLKFRRGRLLAGNQNVKGERRTFRTREHEGSVDDNQPGGEKVVLRHQDLQQGKKDEKGLFNNVIEETASKLVETRKSKVKALVGAFETVISLQDAKLSANT
ncbi:Detected protein of unknown function [Hibiscus syriacus]|uniref:Calmodulin-binding domain-containing protein n=1 Tax=Hibiscus syriacus TaxID=106335 RepID=A0A6A2Y3R1_HIBSY|nr:uncharacterized protein LOC120162825 [Hibiscus syriacus]KAE8678440.1 Detected protein of unknown function [Hibiscus syriacus]